MIAFVRYTLLFWRTYLVRTLLSKRTVIVLLGCCVPPALVWVALSLPRGPWPIEAFMYPSFYLVLQLAVPLAAVIAGSGVIADELEDRTITYLTTRPIPRPAILIGRWLATLTVLLALVAASVAGVAAIVEYKAKAFEPPPPRVYEIQARGDRPARTVTEDNRPPEVLVGAMPDGHLPDGLLASVLTAAALGVGVYSAVFAALGARLKHPLIVGLAFTGAIEGVLANLPGKSQTWTVQYYLRSYLLAQHPELWKALSDVDMPRFDSAPEAVTKLLIVLVVALGTGSFLVARREYVVTS